MGHGDFDASSGEGVLVLENEDHTSDLASDAAIGEMLVDEPTLRLAFLNACNTAENSADTEQGPFAGVATALIASGVPSVIAMKFPISDQAAITFSDSIYEQLPQCLPLETVVSEARKTVHQDEQKRNPDAMEWATPSVYTRGESGQIFQSPYASAKSLAGPDLLEYTSLAENVRSEWIKGKFDRDIPMKPPIELDKELVPKATAKQRVNQETKELPAGKSIGSVFDEHDRSLLILGEPGHGKTIALLALAQYLLERVDLDPKEPVPIVVDLSTWPDSDLPILQWAARCVRTLSNQRASFGTMDTI